ncbi:unnamed protein product [Cuscuta europaea]|uniref:X8 domain-containing protein n=1 Tax=Cuscuta europaea TaxID=41803 RepID=A0A9P0Z3T4_CUSEU|nr:unnamed protein product [Cuscuta europaea]
MANKNRSIICFLCAAAAALLFAAPSESAIGVNWGTLSLHKLSPPKVVDLLKYNGIWKVKLFEADPDVLRALMGSGIEVMVGIPNELLSLIASSSSAADLWVSQNVTRYMVRGGVNIKYVAVGNEPFLTSYSGQYQSDVLPALSNIQQSLVKTNLAGSIKLVVPCNADAYESPSLPSQGTTHQVVDGPNVYFNAFDGNFDTLVSALSKIGYSQMPIVIGEVGWPTDGAVSANITAARAFNQGLVNHVLRNQGTPLRPGAPPMDVYLFSLLDEDGKSILPGNFERHWGMFSFDGQAKYKLNLGNGLLRNAKEVSYLPSRWCVAKPDRDLSMVDNHFRTACSFADCTTLDYGGSCNGIGPKGNVSYAFNSYYQLQKQNPGSCDFDGLGMVTFLDPSIGECRFLVGVTDGKSSGLNLHRSWVITALMTFGCILFCVTTI